MNTIPRETNRFSLPECWIYKNHQYIHHKKDYMIEKLPTTDKKYEIVLKQLNIPYRFIKNEQGEEKCEYWNPDSYREEEINLPLYVSISSGTYKFVRMHSQKIPTKETIKAARATESIVCREIKQYNWKLALIECGRSYKILLNGKPAVGTFLSEHERYSSDAFTDVSFDDEHYKVIRLIGKSRYGSSYIAIFDVNKIELDSVVTMEVPKGTEGIFIGKNGQQVKFWCELLGLKKINVVSKNN